MGMGVMGGRSPQPRANSFSLTTCSSLASHYSPPALPCLLLCACSRLLLILSRTINSALCF